MVVWMLLLRLLRMVGMRLLGMLLLLVGMVGRLLMRVDDARSGVVSGEVVWRRQALGGVGMMLAKHVG